MFGTMIAREIGFLLVLTVALADVSVGTPEAEAEPETEYVFKTVGDSFEMGYCFGMDYIMVYKSTGSGSGLLGTFWGNLTSEDDGSRIRIINLRKELWEIQISNLMQSDSGGYQIECWQNKIMHHLRCTLMVCNQEVTSQEIVVLPNGGAELLCNNTPVETEGTAVQWYREVYPDFNTVLFLDTNVLMEPLQDNLRGAVWVNGPAGQLHVTAQVLAESRHFSCLVMHRGQCLSLRDANLPESEETDVRMVYTSEGEELELPCSSVPNLQRVFWETPMGRVDSVEALVPMAGAEQRVAQILVFHNGRSGNGSLYIPSMTANHSGSYRCLSPAVLAEYSLVFCPELQPATILFPASTDAALMCDPEKEKSNTVRWYRRRGQEDQLLVDSDNPSFAVPLDLRGRLMFSGPGSSGPGSSVPGSLGPGSSELGSSGSHSLGPGSSLIIWNLTLGDAGVYWCMVLEAVEYLGEDIDYPASEVEGVSEEEEGENEWVFDQSETCLSRRVTHLQYDPRPDPVDMTTQSLDPKPNIEPISKSDYKSDIKLDPKPDQAQYSVIPVVVGGVVAFLLILGVVVAVVVWCNKARAHSPTEGTELNEGVNTALDPSHNQP